MRLLACLTLFCAMIAQPVFAQNFDSLFQVDESQSVLQIGGDKEATVEARLKKGDKVGVVVFELELTIPKGANSYSQAKDFAKPTVIKLSNVDGWTALDKAFIPNPKPKKAFDEVFGKEVEKLVGTTTFSRRYLAPSGTKIESAEFLGKISFLLCDKGSCTPKNVDFKATLSADKKETVSEKGEAAEGEKNELLSLLSAPTEDAPRATPEEVPAPAAEEPSATDDSKSEGDETQNSELQFGYQITPQRKSGGELKDDPAQIQFELGPTDAQPGELVTVAITMTIQDRWSTYGLTKADETQLERPTVIKLNPENLTPVESLISAPPPVVHETDLGDQVVRSNAHEHQVTWLQKYKVAAAGDFGVEGTIKYQICEDRTRCLSPNVIPFSLGSSQKPDHVLAAVPTSESFLNPSEELLAGISHEDDQSKLAYSSDGETSVSSVWGAVGLAFLTGLLMNVMPCVLPVLAIKVLSLVQQAGENRGRIIALNSAYTVGVLFVFFGFAILSWGLGKSLTSVFQNATFNIVMACVVFTMGLSLFGVFELPIPGIIPSANDHQEGYFGAFNTGIIATLLGIPCIGPFVVPFFTWTLSQPAPVVFLVFGMMGIGMASPYLLTGIFPALVNWLPRPGMWMVRFKQFTGFVLMGTVIWLMYSIPEETRLASLILFLAIGLLVWMLHNLPDPTKSFSAEWKTYAFSVVGAAPVFAVAFGIMFYETEMPWEPFSEQRMVELREEGVPMLIDFTADWCAVCKWNEAFALNTHEAVAFVEDHKIVPMLADYTKEDPEIQKWLKTFGQDGPPLTLIVPPGKDSEVILLRGRIPKPVLLSKLEQAMTGEEEEGSSIANEQTASNAENSTKSIN